MVGREVPRSLVNYTYLFNGVSTDHLEGSGLMNGSDY